MCSRLSKKARLSIFICAAALMPAACDPQPQACAGSSVFCAGLVTDFGPVTEGIQQEAWLALQDARTAGLVDRIDRIETVDVRDRAANIRTFAEDGYDIIVTTGATMSDETREAAHEYPHLLFVGVEQPQEAKVPNLTGLVFHEERGGFLAGALAALTTKTHRIAAVCEAKFVDAVRRYCDGFEAGAKYIDPTVQPSVVYREGSTDDLFRDRVWGHAEALNQVNQGADIVFAAGGETADAALEAAAAHGALIIGTESDIYGQLADARPQALTSAVNEVRNGVQELVRLAKQGQFPSGQYFGEVGLAPYHELDSHISASTKSRILQLGQDLEDGIILLDIPYVSP